MAVTSSDLNSDLERNWGGLAHEALLGTEELSQLTAEAEACQLSAQSSSCEAVEVIEAPDGHEPGSPITTLSWRLKPGSPWWAYRLVHLSKPYVREGCSRPINMISGCTGISSESFVAKASLSFALLSLSQDF